MKRVPLGPLKSTEHRFDPDKKQWRGDLYQVFIGVICGEKSFRRSVSKV